MCSSDLEEHLDDLGRRPVDSAVSADVLTRVAEIGSDESLRMLVAPGPAMRLDDFELGLRVGWGLNDTSPNFFSNVGVGVRY